MTSSSHRHHEAFCPVTVCVHFILISSSALLAQQVSPRVPTGSLTSHHQPHPAPHHQPEILTAHQVATCLLILHCCYKPINSVSATPCIRRSPPALAAHLQPTELHLLPSPAVVYPLHHKTSVLQLTFPTFVLLLSPTSCSLTAYTQQCIPSIQHGPEQQ